MRRRSARLTACVATAAVTAAVGVALAPAASAGPDRTTLLPQQARDVGNAQGNVPDVPPFGRKLG